MSWLICGTIPDESMGLLQGPAHWENEALRIAGTAVPVLRGTPALVAAAAITCNQLTLPAPQVLLAGDCGKGKGSRELYTHLANSLPLMAPQGITFHYLLPDVDWQSKLLLAVQALPHRPVLVADAGYMYAVKMSGCAPEFDLFTPDAGELAFLADEEAPHPFYTRGFLLDDRQPTKELIERAVATGGAAKAMLVKGSSDTIVLHGNITDTITTPSREAMEAIGGTGDTVTGIATSLLHAGLPMRTALVAAALANRIMAQHACPTPATQVAELLHHLPAALHEALQQTNESIN